MIPCYHPRRDPSDAVRAIIEAKFQATLDLCGDQRAFLLPRISVIYDFLLATFPAHAVQEFPKAKDAWGDPIVMPMEKETQ